MFWKRKRTVPAAPLRTGSRCAVPFDRAKAAVCGTHRDEGRRNTRKKAGTGIVQRRHLMRRAAAVSLPALAACLILFVFADPFGICGRRVKLKDITIQTQAFTESNRELRNPDRGFYCLYTFTISDEEETYSAEVGKYCRMTPAHTLVLLEINLQNYREGDISQAGLANIDALLDTWAKSGRQLIVRFLYDWDGENLLHEPETLDIILRHIAQTGPLLQRHADAIFTLQGLFVGSWGEMHSTRFGSDDDLRRLAHALVQATGGNLYLSVRTPAQWRAITRRGADRQLAARIGLFNDGILASQTDLGTYDSPGQGAERRTRDRELDFQEKLCAGVPNGGEVVSDNVYNDFENAVNDLSAMHITYLNQDYDREVLDKWAAATMSGRGCFDGLDGLSYIQRRLGYRLFIRQVSVSQELSPQRLLVAADFQNAGFAPLYASPKVTLVLQRESDSATLSCPMEHNLPELPGGNMTQMVGTAQAEVVLENLTEDTWHIYLNLEDPASGMPVLLANEQPRGKNGYFLGTVTVQ